MMPAAWVGQLNMQARPACFSLGTLNIVCDRPDNRDHDFGKKLLESIAETSLAMTAGFLTPPGVPSVDWTSAQIDEVTTHFAKRS